MTQYIRFKINLPKCPHCRDYIERNVRNINVDSIRVGYYNRWGTDIEFSYDEKKHAVMDKYKLERELKSQIQELGYTVS